MQNLQSGQQIMIAAIIGGRQDKGSSYPTLHVRTLGEPIHATFIEYVEYLDDEWSFKRDPSISGFDLTQVARVYLGSNPANTRHVLTTHIVKAFSPIVQQMFYQK